MYSAGQSFWISCTARRTHIPHQPSVGTLTLVCTGQDYPPTKDILIGMVIIGKFSGTENECSVINLKFGAQIISEASFCMTSIAMLLFFPSLYFAWSSPFGDSSRQMIRSFFYSDCWTGGRAGGQGSHHPPTPRNGLTDGQPEGRN